MHQIVALHGSLKRSGQVDGARIVDENIDSAKGLDGFIDGRLDQLFVTNVYDTGQCFAASRFDLFGSGLDGSIEFRVRFGSFSCDGDIGTIACGAKCDGFTDAAACASDK